MDERDGAPPRVLLTGATGFIGRHLQRTFLDAGWPVTALVRPGSPRRAALLPGVAPLAAALDDRPALDAALRSCDLVVYCAGAVRGRAPADFHAANVAGVEAVAQAASEAMARPRVVLVSSLAASRPHLSDYAASKAAGERVLAGQAGVGWVVLRPPAVYGPGDREMRPLLAGIRAGLALAVGPPGQRLSLLYAADLAAAVRRAVECFDRCRGEVYAIDDGRPGGYGWEDIVAEARGALPVLTLRVPVSVLEALARLNLARARRFGGLPMLTPGKVRELSEPAWLCDNRAFTGATGWTPATGLRDGVRATFARPG